MSSLNDFIVEYPNVLSDEFCDHLVAKFEDNIQYSCVGQTGTGLNAYEDDSRKTKISTDLFITNMSQFDEEDSTLCSALSESLMKYHRLMSGISCTYDQVRNLTDKGFQIQRTEVGGKYDWHTDEYVGAILSSVRRTKPHRSGRVDAYAIYERRMYTYIFYLNDQSKDFEGGNTEFIVGLDGEVRVVKPEKGKLIMFPANALCTHRGAPVTSGKKYLATGWVVNTIFSTGGDTELYTDELCLRYNDFMDNLNEAITS